ncbi:prolipoprotein diacylglyceryl transferase, partial [Clostridioides difficile]|nr:prolipoprotein diacylglyceryl transferase [Clostridioides difficile]
IVKNGVEYIQVHPTFFYESIWNLLVLLFMLWYRKRKRFDGEMLFIYLLGYGLGRVWIEGLRTDQLIFFSTGIPVSQALSLIL